MSNPLEAQIKNRIAEFVSELDLLVRKSTLEALQGVLGNGAAAPAPRGPGRPAGSGRGPGRPKGPGRRSVDLGDATVQILAHVQANDAQGIGAIAGATGLDLKVAKKAAIALLASGALKKSGQKRGTVYHVGSGRAPRAASAGKRGARKAKKATTTRRKKPAAAPSHGKAVLTPARRRSPSSSKRVAAPGAVSTDVPEALSK